MAIHTGRRNEPPVMLVIGNLREWSRKGRNLPEIEGFHFAGYSELDDSLLASVAPDIVLSALMADNYDALDVARVLAKAGFHGRYRAVTTTLPRPEAILAEVRSVAPGLDFDLYVIDPPTEE